MTLNGHQPVSSNIAKLGAMMPCHEPGYGHEAAGIYRRTWQRGGDSNLAARRAHATEPAASGRHTHGLLRGRPGGPVLHHNVSGGTREARLDGGPQCTN